MVILGASLIVILSASPIVILSASPIVILSASPIVILSASEGSAFSPHQTYRKRSFVADAPQGDSGGKMLF